ncbi:MAG: hypothetical protein IPO83_09020 [Chitinophagaceae bacterium]|nr:hypothetical protein [Chitinophagaceae bacterium]
MKNTNHLSGIFLLPVFAGLLILASCKHDIPLVPTDPNDTTIIDTSGTDTTVIVGDSDLCDPDSVYFEKDVLPILTSNCAMSGCHDAETQAEDVNLTSYTSVMNTSDVEPFNPGNSKLYKVITTSDVDDRMPPSGDPLTASQIAIIEKWINQGALNITCNANAGVCDTTNVTWSGVVSPILQTYCTGCHNAANASGGIILSEYGGAAAVALNGKLVGTITFANGFSQMPPSGTMMPSCEITQITKWVNDGAPNN